MAELLTDEEKSKGMVFPPQKAILDVSFNIATRVASVAFNSGMARVDKPDNISDWIKNMLYVPEYR